MADDQVIDSFKGEWHFLSNFASCTVVYDDEVYPSVEHAFQAAKTFDLTERARIRTAATPSASKVLGRKVALRSDWEEVKIDVMRGLLASKFSQGLARSVLLATGARTLVEGNFWHDQEYGSCTCIKHRDTPGRNQLGLLLMELRTKLRDDDEPG